MPRNGDGASDNGPIQGKEILHGVDGDVCIHVASFPTFSLREGTTTHKSSIGPTHIQIYSV